MALLACKVTAADVAVRVRGRVVAVEVEGAVVLVLVVVATSVQHHPGGVVVAVIRSQAQKERPKPERNTGLLVQ